jgi:hypothetical protein
VPGKKLRIFGFNGEQCSLFVTAVGTLSRLVDSSFRPKHSDHSLHGDVRDRELDVAEADADFDEALLRAAPRSCPCLQRCLQQHVLGGRIDALRVPHLQHDRLQGPVGEVEAR